MLGINNNQVMKGKRQSKKNKKGIKVTHISSPVNFTTSASNFRALVQELTGQDSNVAEIFVDANGVDGVQKGSTQQQCIDAYLSESNWLKPDYNELHLRSPMEPLNELLQYEFATLMQ